MLRRTFVLGSLVGALPATLAACGEKMPAEAPEAVVQQIYDPYFGRGDTSRRRLNNSAPWTDELKDKITRADRKATDTSTAWIDFDPFFGARAVAVGELAVTPQAPPANGHATVNVRFTLTVDNSMVRTAPPPGAPPPAAEPATPPAPISSQVTYELVAVDGEWRVENIHNDAYNLRNLVDTFLGETSS